MNKQENEMILSFLKKYESSILWNTHTALDSLCNKLEKNEILNECYLECARRMKYYNPDKKNINTFLYQYGMKSVVITLLSRYNNTLLRMPISRTRRYRTIFNEYKLQKWESLYYEDEKEAEKRSLPSIPFNEEDIDKKRDLKIILKSLNKLIKQGKVRSNKVRAFLDYYLNEKTFRELGSEYGVSQTAIKDWRNEVMKKLRKELKKKGYKINV